MRKAVIVAGLVLAVSAGGAGAAFAAGAAAEDPASEQADEAQYTQQHLGEAKISEQQAVAAALTRHPGQATDVHLQDEGDGLRWEVKVRQRHAGLGNPG